MAWTKQQLMEKAKEAGVDISGVNNHLIACKMVRTALEGKPVPAPRKDRTPPRRSIDDLAKSIDYTIAPKMANVVKQFFKYDEILSDTTPQVQEMTGEQLTEKLSDTYDGGKIDAYGGIKIVGASRRPNVAQATLPHRNPGVYWRPAQYPITAIVEYEGRMGYIWHDQLVGKTEDGKPYGLPGIRTIFEQMWPEYLSRFTGRGKEHIVFPVGTTKWGVDINTVNAVMREIERKERIAQKAGVDV